MPLPDAIESVAKSERDARCEIADEVAILDGEHFFIRGNIQLPLVDAEGVFAWTAWSTLSRANVKRAVEVWEEPGRETEPPYFGWLATRLPGYPYIEALALNVITSPVGQRPRLMIDPTSDHPLAIEQREGITMARVRELAEMLLHPGAG